MGLFSSEETKAKVQRLHGKETEDCTKNRYDYDKSKTEKNDFTEQIEL